MMDGSKWIATVASIWIQCTCGSSYAFGIYSPLLKSTQGYSQSTFDTVSVFKDIVANAGIFSGLLYSSVAVRRGFVGDVIGSWEDVLTLCERSHLQPQILFFESVTENTPLSLSLQSFKFKNGQF